MASEPTASTTPLRPRPRPRTRIRTLAVVWAVASLALVVAALAVMTIDRTPSAEAGHANLARLWPFWLASASSWGALTLLWGTLRASPREAAPPRFGATAVIVLGVAALARVVVVATHEPALSDDVYRYVFDGRNGEAGVNPYLVTPEARIASIDAGGDERWAGEAPVAALVNNPELHTIYLPTSQWVFAAAGTAIPDAAAGPSAAARVLRGLFVAIELAAVGLLLVALRRRGARPGGLYAWHPLPLAEIAGAGHQDAIGLALLVATLVLATPAPRPVLRWIGTLALAVLVKPVALPVAAFLLRGRPRRSWAAALALGAAVVLAVAVPLWAGGDGEAWRNVRATATRFSLKWAHFGSVYEPTLAAIEHFTPSWTNDPQERLARGVCAGVLLVVVVVIWRRGRDAWSDAAALLLAMVLLSPAAHPWYLLWALVLVPVAPSRAVWAASLTLPWGYAVLGDPVEWTVPPWLMVAAYAPVYGLLAAAAVRALGRPAPSAAAA